MLDSPQPASPKQLRNQITDFLETVKQSDLIPLIAIIGPTASGKTALGVALARAFSGEIVSADSRQIYREMNIGTAKPTSVEQHAAHHHLIDLISPDQNFTLFDYQKLANQTIADINRRKKIPILVGGTGLYINSVIQNYLLPESKPDPILRQEMEDLAKTKGKEAVHKILEKLDPDSAAQIHANNLRYVIRAIEIGRQTRQPKASQTAASPYRTFYISVDWPRDELYDRINRRIDGQVAAGLIDETRQLLAKYPDNPPALTSLGYQEIGEYLAGKTTLDYALDQFKMHTRNYAKRQLTWFRKIKSVYSVPGTELPEFISAFQKNT
jgi:tRNA dimethylallyltransferase